MTKKHQPYSSKFFHGERWRTLKKIPGRLIVQGLSGLNGVKIQTYSSLFSTSSTN